MRVEKYGVSLVRLTREKLELVRNWRNDPKISQYMEYRDYITPEMHARWFDKVDNDNNYYFIIEYLGEEIGLVNMRDIDYSSGEGEGGIYIYADEYLNSDISFRVILCLMDFCFDELKFNRTIAHILRDNKRAIKFNKFIGFKISDNQEDIENQLYSLTQEDYYKQRDKIIKLF